MKATLMFGAGDVRIADVPEPTIKHPTDAIVRTVRACVCGSDLHPYHNMPHDDAGNPFFTAAGSPYHLADIRKKQAAQAAGAAEKETKEENPSGESETRPVPAPNTPRAAAPNGASPKENRPGDSQPS